MKKEYYVGNLNSKETEIKAQYGTNKFRQLNKIIEVNGLLIKGIEKIKLTIHNSKFTNYVLIVFFNSDGYEVARRIMSSSEKLIVQDGLIDTVEYIIA